MHCCVSYIITTVVTSVSATTLTGKLSSMNHTKHTLIFGILLFITIWVNADNSSTPAVITVNEARGRVQILETVYLSSLQTIHRNYFRDDQRLPVPSRVLEDVFYSVRSRNGIKSRWIAVNTPAMNVEHKPKLGFETRAVAALTENKSRFEEINADVFYSARSVTLLASCQRCHLSALAQQNGGRRVAGLIIEIPLKNTTGGNENGTSKKNNK